VKLVQKLVGESNQESTLLIKVKTMVLTKTKIIDGRDHLLGRLASVVAKELLAGQTIVIVRCDEIAVSGSCK
jgi:ribosomal protein L13